MLSFSSLIVLAHSIVVNLSMVPGVTSQILPFIAILATHRQAVLISHIIWLALVPHCEVKRSTSGPLPLTLNIKVTSSYPIPSVNIPIQHSKSGLDEVVLLLAAWLRQVPVVSHSALHGLKPVEAGDVGASTTGVVVATLRSLPTIIVAVWIVRAACPVPTTSV